MTSAQRLVDLQQASRFLEAIDLGARTWTFLTFDDGPNNRRELVGQKHGTLEQCAPWLEAQNAKGAGIFVTINETDGKGRKADNIIRVRSLFADFDHPQPGTLERLRADPRPPSVIVESSAGKLHAYWVADGLELAEFQLLQKAVVSRWDSDPSVCDLPRVMRLPGFLHKKGEPQPVRLLEYSGPRYGRELTEYFQACAPAAATQNLPESTQSKTDDELGAYAARALKRASKAVENAVEGERNCTLNTQAFGIGQLVAGGWIPEALARASLLEVAEIAGLGRSEATSTIRSAFTAGAKYPRTASNVDADQWLDDLDDKPEQGNQPASRTLLPVELGDIMTATPDPVRYAVKQWMPRRHVTLFGGHGGIGKSSLALAIGAHVACGLPFAGLPVEQSSVLFVSLEDEARIVRLRLRRIIEEYQLPAERVLAGLRLLDGTLTFATLMTEGDGFSATPILTPAFRELVSHVDGAGLIIIDNASDAFDANENSRRAVRAFIRRLAELARQNDAAVVLLAHIDKNAARNGGGGNNYSGSTAWHNSARSRMALIEEEGRTVLAHEKANLSTRADPVEIVFVDGVPVPKMHAREDGQSPDDFNQQQIIRAMMAAQEAGITVPASLTPGAHSAMKALEALPEYTHTFVGQLGRKRAISTLTALLREKKIKRVEYRTENRKKKERLELVDWLFAPVECAAPPPYTPSAERRTLEGACATAPILTGACANWDWRSGADDEEDLIGEDWDQVDLIGEV